MHAPESPCPSCGCRRWHPAADGSSFLACEECGLHVTSAGDPVGWCVRIAGHPGGVVPFDAVRKVLGTGRLRAADIAAVIATSAISALEDPDVVREAIRRNDRVDEAEADILLSKVRNLA